MSFNFSDIFRARTIRRIGRYTKTSRGVVETQPITQQASYLNTQFLHAGSQLYDKPRASEIVGIWIKL